jgi:hypothetical protein
MTNQSVTWQADLVTGCECCKAMMHVLILPIVESFQVVCKETLKEEVGRDVALSLAALLFGLRTAFICIVPCVFSL